MSLLLCFLSSNVGLIHPTSLIDKIMSMEKLGKSAGDVCLWPPLSSQAGLGPGQAVQLVLSAVDPSTVAINTSPVPWDHLALRK